MTAVISVPMKPIRILAAAAVLACATPAFAAPQYGIAMQGDPALAADFTHLPYTNPDAPQGGSLHQALTGSFDSVNPFIVKGNAGLGGSHLCVRKPDGAELGRAVFALWACWRN